MPQQNPTQVLALHNTSDRVTPCDSSRACLPPSRHMGVYSVEVEGTLFSSGLRLFQRKTKHSKTLSSVAFWADPPFGSRMFQRAVSASGRQRRVQLPGLGHLGAASELINPRGPQNKPRPNGSTGCTSRVGERTEASKKKEATFGPEVVPGECTCMPERLVFVPFPTVCERSS